MEKWLVFSVLGQMALTAVVYLRLLSSKKAAIKDKKVDRDRTRIHIDGWPDSVQVVNNNLTSQYQLPVLFYVLAILLMATGKVGITEVIVCWGFVLSRFAHMMIHTGKNVVRWRFRSFLVGVVCILVLMALTAYHWICL